MDGLLSRPSVAPAALRVARDFIPSQKKSKFAVAQTGTHWIADPHAAHRTRGVAAPAASLRPARED